MPPKNGEKVILILGLVLIVVILFSMGLVGYYVLTLDVATGAKLATLGEHLSALVQTLLAGIVGWLLGTHTPGNGSGH